MTLCPVAMTAGCRRCPIFAVCPLRTVIGDQSSQNDASKASQQEKPKSGGGGR